MTKTNALRATRTGLAATLVMSGVAAVAPLMGLPAMNPAAMLASQMGGPAPVRGALFALAEHLLGER